MHRLEHTKLKRNCKFSVSICFDPTIDLNSLIEEDVEILVESVYLEFQNMVRNKGL